MNAEHSSSIIPIQFYNTLTRTKETFQPLTPKTVRLYTCGPTVYDFAHIGNFRAYIFEDLLHRFLAFAGYRVLRVMNITDIDDKTIAGAIKEGISLREYTDRYIAAFMKDCETLRLAKPDHLPRATDHIPEMVQLVKTLLEKGIAYEKEGSIYFRISSFPGYGQLCRYDFNEIKTAARTDADEYEKEEARDFVLWKESKKEEPSWETEIGSGRPGWHIECSAMSMKYLGETFDIHTGGVDNIFPHHDNEIAQSEAATGKLFVKYWLHCAHLLVNGEKMSKSKGNFYTLRTLLEKGADPIAIRYLLLTTHYRDPLNFSEQSLQQAFNTIRHWQAYYQRLDFPVPEKPANPVVQSAIERAREKFSSSLADDLNISSAVAGIFEMMKTTNIAFSTGDISPQDTVALKKFLLEIDSVMAILDPQKEALPQDLMEQIMLRNTAREKKDFSTADIIRNELAKQGILLEDTPFGTRWIKQI
ncbi:MAG: cysteine--tRNA ligase [Candidatus Ratteibacteria bacterium]